MTALDLIRRVDPWMVDAACAGVDQDIFFPARGRSCGPAKQVCARCDVRTECLEFALVNNVHHGIWGGTSERERRSLRIRRHGSASAYDKGCRCVSCRQAKRDRLAQLGRQKTVVERQPAQHGTASKYSAGCRCDQCREARQEYDRRRYLRDRA